MKATFLKGVVLGSVVSFAMLTATAAFAGSGVGAIFNLGTGNSVNASTGISGSTNANMLGVKNVNTGANAGGIGISVASGKPPLKVNSSTKVSNLNADLLDGKHSSAFQAPLSVTVVTSAISNVGGFAQCPSGYKVTGGGYNLPFVSDVTKRDFVRQSSPDSQGWSVTLDPSAANAFQVNSGSTVYAVCVK